MGELDGKVALVTGAARGQGRAHALALARAGADVAILDVCAPAPTVPYELASEADLAETARQVEAAGRRPVAIVADVRDTTAVDAAVSETVSRLGRLDICVANAGICSFAPFVDITDEMWDEMIAVDLTGVFKTLRAVTPHLVAQGSGRIIATSSMGGRRGTANLAHYVAAKFGVIGLVKTLALEVAAHGVTVNAVCPTTVDTPMVHNPAFYGLFCPGVEDPSRASVEATYARMSPMGTPWLDPSEVADAVVFLASDRARHISGTTLEVGAGASALQH